MNKQILLLKAKEAGFKAGKYGVIGWLFATKQITAAQYNNLRSMSQDQLFIHLQQL